MWFLLFTNTIICTSKSPVIRPYQKDTDQAAIIAIFKQNPQYLLGTEWGNTEEEQLTMAKKYLESEKYHTLVLEVDTVPVGFVNYCVYSVPLYGWIFGQKEALFHLFGISRDHKRKGYGLLLSRKAIESIKMEKVSSIGLYVYEDNRSAIALYEKLGFKSAQGYLHTKFNSFFGIPIFYRLNF